MNIISKLNKIGLELPNISKPGGNYVSVNIRGNIAYVAIQFPIINEQYFYQGKLGSTISTEEGYLAMRTCALNVLAQIENKIGFENVIGLNHFDAFYQSSEGWDESPAIVNGASDLFKELLGDAGTHSRSILGVNNLPRNFCVGLTATFTINNYQ